MTRTAAYMFVVGLLLVLQVGLYQQTFADKKTIDGKVRVNYVLPVEFSRAAALDFQGLAADFQLLEAIFFIGEKFEQHESLTDADWSYVTRIINAVIRLDPYFYDTYHFSAGTLTWGAGRYQDAIEILNYARKYRTDDYRLPFYIGFINFYFLNDAKKGAQYFNIASQLPEAPPILASLASRYAYYAGNYAFSINLLKRMLSTERSQEIRHYYQKRLSALEGALLIEKATAEFKKEHLRIPFTPQELVASGFVDSLPLEPYGGDWFILENGRAYSTSKFAESPERSSDDK